MKDFKKDWHLIVQICPELEKPTRQMFYIFHILL